MPHLTSFNQVFSSLKNSSTYMSWVKKRICKIVLGSSVIRVFVEGTKYSLLKCLDNIPIDEVIKIQSQTAYDKWHYKQVNKVYICLKSQRGNTKRIDNDEGLKFGHATKIVNLFIGHLIFYSPYFKKKHTKCVYNFLHVPLDSKVFDALRVCSEQQVPSTIKEVTKETYYSIQEEIRQHAVAYKIPPLCFDDYAWTFEKE